MCTLGQLQQPTRAGGSSKNEWQPKNHGWQNGIEFRERKGQYTLEPEMYVLHAQIAGAIIRYSGSGGSGGGGGKSVTSGTTGLIVGVAPVTGGSSRGCIMNAIEDVTWNSGDIGTLSDVTTLLL